MYKFHAMFQIFAKVDGVHCPCGKPTTWRPGAFAQVYSRGLGIGTGTFRHFHQQPVACKGTGSFENFMVSLKVYKYIDMYIHDHMHTYAYIRICMSYIFIMSIFILKSGKPLIMCIYIHICIYYICKYSVEHPKTVKQQNYHGNHFTVLKTTFCMKLSASQLRTVKCTDAILFKWAARPRETPVTAVIFGGWNSILYGFLLVFPCCCLHICSCSS